MQLNFGKVKIELVRVDDTYLYQILCAIYVFNNINEQTSINHAQMNTILVSDFELYLLSYFEYNDIAFFR